MFRKLLREVVRGKTAPDAKQQKWLIEGESLPLYSQDTVLYAPKCDSAEEDRKLILELGKKVINVMRAADDVQPAQRDAFVRAKLDEIDDGVGKERAREVAVAHA